MLGHNYDGAILQVLNVRVAFGCDGYHRFCEPKPCGLNFMGIIAENPNYLCPQLIESFPHRSHGLGRKRCSLDQCACFNPTAPFVELREYIMPGIGLPPKMGIVRTCKALTDVFARRYA
jgi:hypothetical protein